MQKSYKQMEKNSWKVRNYPSNSKLPSSTVPKYAYDICYAAKQEMNIKVFYIQKLFFWKARHEFMVYITV